MMISFFSGFMLLWYYTMNIQTLSHKEYYTERSRRNSDKKIICCFARSLISLHLISLLFFLSFIPTSLFVSFFLIFFSSLTETHSIVRSYRATRGRRAKGPGVGLIIKQFHSHVRTLFFFFPNFWSSLFSWVCFSHTIVTQHHVILMRPAAARQWPSSAILPLFVVGLDGDAKNRWKQHSDEND